MTGERDIVDRLIERSEELRHHLFRPHGLHEILDEAVDEIVALRLKVPT